ncbi:MAG: CHC2 zinc finger domain-containing protein [Verrucomicrobiota bacterium]|jgi:DNA primase|nr:CHC2 zinc finger domain-containing protein [Verrucomicrobiota bacterium]MDP7638195.1 CHC2 zinc finger domain-containing protein [Candidatus Hydrogenedentota bacterium]|tara:strand:- start:27 stop:383 length:357 start_codon:yes stop_codon:yes gene_type:complete
MPKHYAKQTLRRLRNDIPINILIAGILELPHKTAEGYFRYLCPLCGGFDTATNPKTNLARCFTCQRNFNPIDITMQVKRLNFREAVQFLLGIKTVDAKKLCTDLAASMSAQGQTTSER